MDTDGEMILALANMEIYEQLSVEYMKKQETHLANAQLLVADMNCPKDVLEYLKALAIAKRFPLLSFQFLLLKWKECQKI